MASHLTSEQVTAKNNISDYLDDINSSSTAVIRTVVNVGITSTRSIGQPTPPPSPAIEKRIERASARLRQLGEVSGNRELTAEEEAERQSLHDGIKKINKELGALDPKDKIGLLSASGTPDAEQENRAAALAEDLRRQAEAADAQDAARVEATEVEDIDETDVEVARAAYQHYLLYNADFFADYHEKYLLTTDPTNDIINTKGYIKGSNNSQPRIFLLADTEDTTVVDNKLNSCPGNERFVGITTAKYAELLPLLRIYKVYRNKDGSNGDMKVEFSFRSKTGLDGIGGLVQINNPVGTEFISIHNRGIECGVKSFDWTFKGSDPFTATRDIEATLVLHAQSFAALSLTHRGPDLIPPTTGDTAKPKVEYKYLDLIIQPDCTKKSSPTDSQPYNGIYNPGCYEIQIDVGYAAQPGDLREVVCCQKDSLFLVHVDHKFDFKEDGTIDLTINYRGRLETIMKDKKFNVLLPGGGFSNDKNAAIIGPYNAVEQDLAAERALPTPSESQIKKLEREREIRIFNLRQYTYSLILETMEEQGMIYRIELDNEHFLRFARWKEPIFAGIAPEKLSISSLTPPVTRAPDSNSATIQIINVEVSDPDTDAIKTTLKKITDLEEEQVSNRLADAVVRKKHTINYIYFGDLLAIVLSNVFGELDVAKISSETSKLGRIADSVRYYAGAPSDSLGETENKFVGSRSQAQPADIYKNLIENFHIILGNIKIIDGHGSVRQVNLAHIPISLESFQDFMMKNVISQNIDYYSLIDFIDDIVGDLITDMFSGEHNNGLVEADSRLSISLHTSKKALNGDIFLKGTSPEYKVLETGLIIGDTFPFGKDHKCADIHSDPYQYLVLNTLNSYPKDLAGDYLGNQNRGDNIGDKNRGIMHFTYGSDRGLLKSVQFSKTDQEYVPEARFASSDGSLLNQLSSVYDATFNMIGNNLFKPGMLLYFNPEPMGVGSPWQYKTDSNGNVISRSWSNIMGIGGYHLITEVAHSIGPGKFDTSVKARWVNSGRSTPPLLPPESTLEPFIDYDPVSGRQITTVETYPTSSV